MVWVAALASALALAVAVGGSGETSASARLGIAGRRMRALKEPVSLLRLTPVPGTHRPRGTRVAAWAAAAACVAVLPWPLGLMAGSVAVVVTPRLLARFEPAAHRRETEQLRSDFPLAADLFAAIVLGGAEPSRAVQAVADALSGPVATRLDAIAAALELGSPPEDAWRGLAGDTVLGPWASAMARTAGSGAPIAGIVAGLADQARSVQAAGAGEAARKAGVWAVAPLGACFLPAFVLLGIVPLVGSLVGDLFAPLL